MSQPKTSTALDDIRIYAFEHPDFCLYNQILPSKLDFLQVVKEVTRACPIMASIWRNILQEPLSLGYFSWDSMVKLIIATHKHNTTHHHCMEEDQTNFLIIMSLLLSRTIHYPPFPGGDDSKSHFYSVTRATITEAYDYFEAFIFKDIDKLMNRRSFQTIRKTLTFYGDDRNIIANGLKTYNIMRELQILPPALVDPLDVAPPLFPPPPLR